jgi:alanyl-tRNA synthetase
MAQGGGTDPAKLGEALAGIAESVRLAAVGA